jgi:hypothetical protein
MFYRVMKVDTTWRAGLISSAVAPTCLALLGRIFSDGDS